MHLLGIWSDHKQIIFNHFTDGKTKECINHGGYSINCSLNNTIIPPRQESSAHMFNRPMCQALCLSLEIY